MKNITNTLAGLLLLIFACGSTAPLTQQPSLTTERPHNILFIAVDDLKPLLSNYGHKEMHTPNFDRLAAMGVTFTNANVQYAVCGPSRASIMTGCFPDRTKVWDLHTDFRKSGDGLVSMPEYLISQGYETVGIGKIYHKGSSAPGHDGKSWSLGHTLPDDYNASTGKPIINYQSAENRARFAAIMAKAETKGIDKTGQQRAYALKQHKPSTESAPVPDDAYQDGVYTKAAIARLKELKSSKKPWMMALGWQRPHLPFVAPQKYWDLYDRDKIDLSGIQEVAEGTPEIAYHNFGEIRSYTDFPKEAVLGDAIPEAKQRELIHGYMACVSYIDAQLGKVLDELEASGLDATTNIVLWGDHGFHLGDHTLWCKHSNFEQATRIPFMFAGPGVAKGTQVAIPVNLVDAFPTLFDLAGVKPSAQAEGKSLVPLLDNDPKTTVEQDFAISQYARGGKKNPTMGYSLRTERYRYTEWHKGYTSADTYSNDNIVGVELYDYEKDPLETQNWAKDKDYMKVVPGLKAQLQRFLEKQRKNLAKSPGVGALEGKPMLVPDAPSGDKKMEGAQHTVKPQGNGRAANALGEKPNVLLIQADDLGYYDLSLTGSRIYQTPNIDRLAASGVSFEQAYSNYPRCTPSRYALMTGTYPVNEDHGHLIGIPQERNFAQLLEEVGYNSFFVGKWHLGHDNNSPTAFGFNASYAAGHAGGVGQRFFPFNIKKNGKRHKEQVPNVEKDGKEGDYISDLMTDKTLDMLKANDKSKPFFAALAFYAVHTPLEAKPEDRERNAKEIAAFDFGDGPEYIKEGAGRRKMRQDDPDYAGMVENVDQNVGRLLDYLEANNLTENTIVVFTSDHGGLSNDGNKNQRHLATSNLPLRAGKGWLYEGGIRVPLIVSWPAKLAPRTDKQSIVLGMDIYPTILDLVADKLVPNIDGKSAEKVLEGKEDWANRTVFWHSAKARPHSTGDADMSVVRSGAYKLVQYNEDGKTELYNLLDDPGETKNLSLEMQAKTKELSVLLNAWKAEYLVPEKMKLRVKG
ncbi:sulfatase-like hydrolase/transferase [Neolewinella persica]|uniref:sulfatase-like hydrolase/transferase n=1 Tax=Neolewinella persica TaxID=70998 RepID=UPI00035C1BD5|nr:sulfatase-like hydrolase/transferase [Neolewinella persica]